MSEIVRWIRFNLWYFRKPPWDTGITPPELEDVLRALRPGRALDLGCGSGTNLLRLLQAGWQVCGVDYAIEAVNRAKTKIRRAGFTADVRLGDVTRVQFLAHSFTLVYDIGCYHSLDAQRQQVYRTRLVEWLVKGGTFLLYAHLKHNQDAASPGISEEDIRAFRALLNLEKRVDSLDRFGRQAVWLTFGQADDDGMANPKDGSL